MEPVFTSATKQDVSEMMPSLCFYYNEMLYCQSFQVRYEISKRTFGVRCQFSGLREALGVLRSDVKHFVKHFMVPLQIYMCDVNSTVKQFSTDLFNVFDSGCASSPGNNSRRASQCCSLQILRRNPPSGRFSRSCRLQCVRSAPHRNRFLFPTFPISRIDKRFHGATPHHIPTRLHRFAPVSNPHSFFFHSAVSLRSLRWHSRSHADRRSQHADSRDGDRELDSLGNAQLFVDGSDAVQQSGSQTALRNGSQRHARHEEPSGQHANDVDDAFAEVGGSAAWRCRYPPIYAETKLDAYTKVLLTRLRK